jgi:tetratricopeptide (TPR) repeat protein
VRRYFANTIATHLDIKQPGAGMVLDAMIEMAPSDPETHYLAAIYYDRTFEAADLTRSVAEFEIAATLSPNTYGKWLDLGRARSRIGDSEGADTAFKRASALAPHYSDVQWTYGNFLVREGRAKEGFPLITQAAAEDPRLAGPAVVLALQLSDGDADRVTDIMGDAPIVTATLVGILTAKKRYQEAYSAWGRLPSEAKRDSKFVDVGTTLMRNLIEVKRFRLAASIAADFVQTESERPVIGQLNNGGFESGVKSHSAGPFEWQIADGVQPQIGLSESQKHSGRYSLWLTFNTFESASFRPVSQTIPVEPGGQYQLEVWYRSALKTPAKLKWEVDNATTLQPLGATAEMVPVADWTRLTVQFTVPLETDGVILRLSRERCIGLSCPMNGTMGLDDFILTRQ